MSGVWGGWVWAGWTPDSPATTPDSPMRSSHFSPFMRCSWTPRPPQEPPQPPFLCLLPISSFNSGIQERVFHIKSNKLDPLVHIAFENGLLVSLSHCWWWIWEARDSNEPSEVLRFLSRFCWVLRIGSSFGLEFVLGFLLFKWGCWVCG